MVPLLKTNTVIIVVPKVKGDMDLKSQVWLKMLTYLGNRQPLAPATMAVHLLDYQCPYL